MITLEHKNSKLWEDDQYVETEKIKLFNYETHVLDILSKEQEKRIVKSDFADKFCNESDRNLCFYREKIIELIKDKKEEQATINAYIENGMRVYIDDSEKEKKFVYNDLFRQTIEINFGDGITLDIGTRKKSFEDFNAFTNRIVQYINYKHQRKVNMQDGIYKVIFDPELTGLLVHELIGHIFEIDTWLENPILKEIFPKRKKITNDYITIVDDPSIQNGYGSYNYDDEGSKARQTILIRNGYIFDFMKAKKYDFENTGSCNGRCVNLGDEILVRMSNTYMLPGKRSVQNLFSEVDCGLYMVGSTNCTFSGVAQIIPREIYRIENGEISKLVKGGIAYIDPVLFLNNILGISSKFVLYGGGLGGCGKKNQWPLPIGSGGPFVAVDNVICKFSEGKQMGLGE